MKRLSVILAFLSVFVIVTITYAQGPGMMAQGMMGSGMMQSEESQKSSEETSGVKTYNANCRVCHVNGGNVINPNMPLRGSSKLAEFKTFLAFIRDPKMPDGSKGPMPSFSEAQISDKQAKELYQYITSEQGLDLTSKGQGWYCPYCGQYLGPRGGYGMGPGMMGEYGMMGGYGMGPGMMGRYGMGPGMMGRGYGMGPGMMGPQYYSQSPECQKFLDETATLRKEFYNKRFEYMEAFRNPKATPETTAKLEKEVRELQEKIFKNAPQGCWW
jgi:cytochrome c553